jgi:hypothetical protein
MTLAEQRMAICNGCEHLGPIIKVCKLCGCFMPAKTMINGSTCPATPPKWISVTDVINSNNCCNKETK